MYPDKTEQQCFQRVEDLIKDDVYRPCELTCEEQARVNEAEKELIEESKFKVAGLKTPVKMVDFVTDEIDDMYKRLQPSIKEQRIRTVAQYPKPFDFNGFIEKYVGPSESTARRLKEIGIIRFNPDGKDLLSFAGLTEDTEYLQTSQQPVGAGKTSQQPKFKPGDRVRVTDRIRHWVKKLGWTEDMLDHIGKIHTVNFHHVAYDEIFYSRSDVEMNCFELKGLLMAWPSDCLELVTD